MLSVTRGGRDATGAAGVDCVVATMHVEGRGVVAMSVGFVETCRGRVIPIW